jgi:hypothetical protein
MPDSPTSEPEPVPAEASEAHSAASRVAILLGLLAAVTVAGVAIGRALEPSSPARAVTTTVATTPAGTTVANRPPPPPHAVSPAPIHWGPLTVTRAGSLPAAPAAGIGAALVGPTLVVIAGTRALAGPVGGRLVPVAKLPSARNSAAVFTIGGTLYVLGGEQGSTPSADLLRVDLASGAVKRIATFEEPLAESGVGTGAGTVVLAGGWTGTQYGTAVLRLTPPSSVQLVARLPEGVRAPAVARLRNTLYVAGGRTPGGLSNAVYAVDLSSGAVTTLGKLPQAVQGAMLVSSGTKLYLLGGRTANGMPSTAVVRIDPATGQPAKDGSTTVPLAGAAAVSDGSRTVVVDPQAGAVYRIG